MTTKDQCGYKQETRVHYLTIHYLLDPKELTFVCSQCETVTVKVTNSFPIIAICAPFQCPQARSTNVENLANEISPMNLITVSVTRLQCCVTERNLNQGFLENCINLYLCHHLECQGALGMEDGAILNGQISASSQLDANHAAIQADLTPKQLQAKQDHGQLSLVTLINGYTSSNTGRKYSQAVGHQLHTRIQ